MENSTVEVNALENTLKGYKETAQSCAQLAEENANTATQQAQIATQKASEALNSVANKANISMNNLSEDGKKNVVGLSMPSAIGQSLTFGASGSQYIAPENGWFCVFVTGVAGSNIQIALQNISTPLRILGMEANFYDYWGAARLFCPVKKGDTVSLNYSGTYSSQYMHFIQTMGG